MFVPGDTQYMNPHRHPSMFLLDSQYTFHIAPLDTMCLLDTLDNTHVKNHRVRLGPQAADRLDSLSHTLVRYKEHFGSGEDTPFLRLPPV